MAVVDADYKFLYLYVGRDGAMSDAQVFKHSLLKRCIEHDTIGLPQPDPLPRDDGPTPYYLVGDDAFPLKQWLMKPYARLHLDHYEKVFNYRLS